MNGYASLARVWCAVVPRLGISIGQSAGRARPLRADPFFKRLFEAQAPQRGAPAELARALARAGSKVISILRGESPPRLVVH